MDCKTDSVGQRREACAFFVLNPIVLKMEFQSLLLDRTLQVVWVIWLNEKFSSKIPLWWFVMSCESIWNFRAKKKSSSSQFRMKLKIPRLPGQLESGRISKIFNKTKKKTKNNDHNEKQKSHHPVDHLVDFGFSLGGAWGCPYRLPDVQYADHRNAGALLTRPQSSKLNELPSAPCPNVFGV